MKRIALTTLLISLAALPGLAQFATFDAAQETHALKQIANDAEKIANQKTSIANEIQQLAKLDAEILRQTAIMQQAIYAATHFDSVLKSKWLAAGNQVVGNWTTPNYYGETAGWTGAVNSGTAPQTGWQAAVLKMQKAMSIALDPLTAARNLSHAASVNTFDGAGPVALQTVGNARQQQIQIDGAIQRLETASLDGSDAMNSQVQQLNLLTAASIIQLRQQQTAATLGTSLLEQQTIANKLQRDQLADRLNFLGKVDAYTASEPVAWGNAAESLKNWRLK